MYLPKEITTKVKVDCAIQVPSEMPVTKLVLIHLTSYYYYYYEYSWLNSRFCTAFLQILFSGI